VLRTTNFTNEGVVNYESVVTRSITKKNIEDKFLRPGDIIIEKSGGSDKQPVGRVIFYEGPENTFLFNNFTGVLRVKDTSKWFPRFVFYSLYSNYRKGGTRAYENKTTGLHNLKTDDYVSRFEVTDANYSEQIKICVLLDKTTNVIRTRQQQLSALDDLIKARFVEMFGDAVINPYRYEQVTIGDACTLINGRAFKPSDWGEEGLPIVRIQNLNDTNASFNYYDGQVNEQHLIDSGMLLFSWSGTPGTSFGAFMWNRGPGALNQHIFKVIPKLDFDLDYLRYAMNGQLSTIIAKAHGGVGLQHITKAELEKIVLLHPKMREQKQFAAFVAQVDKSKSVIQKSLDETQRLFDSLMQKYFG
jgi:type I restriction enzyme S subunit